MKFHDLHPNLRIRIVEIVVVSILNGMLFPFIAIYFSQKFGAAIAGIMMVFFTIIGIITSFYGGYLGDKIGRRRTMLISETIRLFALILAVLANSPWFEWPWITFLVMTINSICWGLAGPAVDAMVIDASSSENRPYVYTLQYWAFNLSMVIGALFGGFLFQSHRFEIYVSVALGSFLSVVLVLCFIKETFLPNDDLAKEKQLGGPLTKIIRDYKTVFKDLTFVKFVFASLLIYSIDTQARNYAGVRLADEFGSKTLLSIGDWSLITDGLNMFGLLTAENSLIVVLVALLIKHIFNKHNKRVILFAGVLLYACGYAIVGFTNSASLLMIMMFMATFGELMWLPIQLSMMAELPPESNRSAYMAVNGLIYHGMNVMGAMAIFIGAYLPSWSMSMLFFITGILSILIYERNMKHFDKRIAANNGNRTMN